MKQQPLSFSMLQLYILSMMYFTANAILIIIIPLHASSTGMSEAEIGIIMGVYMFACMVLRPFAGQMIAKYSVFTIMKWLLVAHLITLCIYSFFGMDFIYVVRILQGVVTAFFSMAMQIGMTEIMSDEDRAQGMSMYSLSTVVPSIYGPILAVFLWYQPSHTFLFVALLLLAFIPMLVFIRSPLPKTRREETSFSLRDYKEGFQIAKKHNGLIFSAVVMLGGAFIFGSLTTFLPLYAVSTKSLNIALYLFIQALVVVGSRFFFRRYIPSDGEWHRPFIAIILVASLIGTTMLIFSSTFGHFVYISAIFNGIATSMLYPTLTTYMSFVIPESHRPVLFGIFLASYDFGFSLGGIVMGFIIQFMSYEMMFICLSSIALIILMINFIIRIPNEKKTVTEE